jgi:hypothetical protein
MGLVFSVWIVHHGFTHRSMNYEKILILLVLWQWHVSRYFVHAFVLPIATIWSLNMATITRNKVINSYENMFILLQSIHFQILSKKICLKLFILVLQREFWLLAFWACLDWKVCQNSGSIWKELIKVITVYLVEERLHNRIWCTWKWCNKNIFLVLTSLKIKERNGIWFELLIVMLNKL